MSSSLFAIRFKEGIYDRGTWYDVTSTSFTFSKSGGAIGIGGSAYRQWYSITNNTLTVYAYSEQSESSVFPDTKTVDVISEGIYKTAALTYSLSASVVSRLSATRTAGGIISFTWPSGTYYTPGTKKSVTATASAGYKFLGWFRNSETMVWGPTYNGVSVQIEAGSADTTYEARFTSTSHSLTVTGNPVESGTTGGDPTGTYTEGTARTISATPVWWAYFDKWTFSGLTASESLSQIYNFTMPANAVTATANFLTRPFYTITASKENGSLGTISLKRHPDEAPFLEEGGVAGAYGFVGVSHSLIAVVTNPTLNMFLGWYVGAVQVSPDLTYTFTQTDTTNLTIVAKFAAKASYTIVKRVTDGGGIVGAGNPAYDAGCSIQENRAADFSSPDKWLGGNITFTPTAATGWVYAGFTVSPAPGATGAAVPFTEDNPFTFSLSYDSIVTGYFGKIQHTVSCAVDAAAAAVSAGTAEIEYGDVTGDEIENVLYGDAVVFKAVAESGYAFAGWFDAVTGDPAPPITIAGVDYVYTDADYVSGPVTMGIALVAKFSATVSLGVSHTAAADDTGTVGIDEGVAGATAEATVVIGEYCTIKAVATEDSLFNAWHLSSDSGFASPIEGYVAEYDLLVSDNTSLVARFIGEADLEDRWMAVKNWDNNEASYSALLGIISSSGGEEMNESDWDAFLAGTVPLGTPENTPGNKYFKFEGTVATTISAIANAGLEFLEWRIAHLVPDGGGFSISTPKIKVGSGAPSIQIVTNRHYVLDAVWGEPTAVKVEVRMAAGSDSSNGEFTLLPVGDDRLPVQGGFSDMYMQGSQIVLAAYISNGHLFSGWYYDAAGTQLISSLSSFTYTVSSPIQIFAKFIQDSDAIYKWEGSTSNKQLEWISKRYVATKPFNPSAAKIYAEGYPVELNVYMSSSPTAPRSSDPVAVNVYDQDGFRLPCGRPDKYLEIGVKSLHKVQAVSVGTSMGGLAQ